MATLSKICCAVDLAAPSRSAMRHAAELAKQLGAELSLLHVVESPEVAVEGAADSAVDKEELGRSATREAERALVGWRAEASTILGRAVAAHVVVGDPHHAIAEFAREQGYELIVAAMNARRRVKERVLGSVTERLLRDAPCPVLVHRTSLASGVTPDDVAA